MLGIIGIVLAKKPKQMFAENPELTGIGMVKAGYIMSIIGLILGALYIVYYIIVIAFIGTAGAGFLEALESLQ